MSQKVRFESKIRYHRFVNNWLSNSGYGNELYPNHPAFDLKFACEQELNLRTSRVLLTYQKISETDAGKANYSSEGIILEHAEFNI